MIAVVDYGMGNLKSVEKGLKKVGCEVLITRDFAKIKESRGLVLPGVGSFRDCMRNLKERELIQPILNFIASGRPFLGICLGMQILFSESEEFGKSRGLNIIKGRVVHFPLQKEIKIPHMGWN
ncbi:imidazole glycerol phosphate synthase subunit HisH, partial [Patescibacteria group bacterium]|nr:imidazole glycerol phosphate synthase subunit HisH [Patescibacteria group bacterium]